MAETLASQILDRLLKPEEPSLSPEFSRSVLSFSFTDAERDRIDELSAKARDGALSADEASELDLLTLTSHFIGALQAKARASLKSKSSAA